MAKKTYSEKLLDPRWQRKRLHIFNRDNFACTLCGDKDATLHVHHTKYEKGKEPWEYEDIVFKTVCKYCHLIHGDWQEMTQHTLIKACQLEEYTDGKEMAVLISDQENEGNKFFYFYRMHEKENSFTITGVMNMEKFSRLFDFVKGIKTCQ